MMMAATAAAPAAVAIIFGMRVSLLSLDNSSSCCFFCSSLSALDCSSWLVSSRFRDWLLQLPSSFRLGLSHGFSRRGGGHYGEHLVVREVLGQEFVLPNDPGDEFLVDPVLLLPELHSLRDGSGITLGRLFSLCRPASRGRTCSCNLGPLQLSLPEDSLHQLLHGVVLPEPMRRSFPFLLLITSVLPSLLMTLMSSCSRLRIRPSSRWQS